MESDIIEDAEELKLISDWIGDERCEFDLLYKGTRDGFTAQKFH